MHSSSIEELKDKSSYGCHLQAPSTGFAIGESLEPPHYVDNCSLLIVAACAAAVGNVPKGLSMPAWADVAG